MLGRDDRDARRVEAHLHVFRRGARQLTEVQKGRPRRRDHDPGGARFQLGDVLLADRARHAQLVASGGDGRLLRVVEREERDRFAVLLERDRERREPGIWRVGGDVERAGLSDDAGRLVDRQLRRCAATGDDVADSSRERESTRSAASQRNMDPIIQVC